MATPASKDSLQAAQANDKPQSALLKEKTSAARRDAPTQLRCERNRCSFDAENEENGRFRSSDRSVAVLP